MSVWSQVMTCETEWRAVDKNLTEDLVSDCARFIVVSVRQWAHIDVFITWLMIKGNSCCLRLNSPPKVGT